MIRGSGVWITGRLLPVWLACCVLALVGWPALATGEDSATEPSPPSPFESGLVIPEMQPLDEGQQIRNAEEARLASPEAVFAREASATEFQGLNTSEAATLAEEVFPTVIDDPAGGPPQLPAGERITAFSAPDAAEVDLGAGRRGVIQSTAPMARQSGPGQFEPLDLSLRDSGGSYVPSVSDVPVRISKRLSSGVEVSASGVSLTPVGITGTALEGSEGSIDGAGVLYANTQTDTDTFAKPTSTGFELSAILRSIESPQQLYYRVGLPDGASLLQDHGAVRVTVGGQTVATVQPPDARDAAGTQVPVSMSVSEDTLIVEVGGGDFQYPIEVDPTVTDEDLTGPVWPVEGSSGTNWVFLANKPQNFGYHTIYTKGGAQSWNVYGTGASPYTSGEYVGLQYQTQGESKIYELDYTASGENGTSATWSYMEFYTHEGAQRTNQILLAAGGYYNKEGKLCVIVTNTCEAQQATQGNLVRFMNVPTQPGGGPSDSLTRAYVHISQDKAPEATFNESAETIGTRANALYNAQYYGEHPGSGSDPWLGPYSNTAFETKAHDPGIGVSWASAQIGAWRTFFPIFEEDKCAGVQCNPDFASTFTYAPSMPDGIQTITWYAKNATGLLYAATQLVKIDSKAPHDVEVSGWPASREISAAPHTLTLKAADGTSPTQSSGVKTIAVSIDGGPETVIAGASCSNGPCTATGKYSLNAEGLSEGVHRLDVTATDNASNVAPTQEFTFNVRHASPVPVGPGSVDPTTGELSLSTKDVALNGVGGVSRTYQSRDLNAGEEGPLGPQWAINLGAGEGLTVLADGSVALTSVEGGRTTFLREPNGEFDSPEGDGNLKLEAKEQVPGKGITEYLLSNAAAGTTTRFTQPSGAQSTTPSYTNQFGSEATQLKTPTSDALDASGNVWVTDTQNNRITKFSASGALLAAYGSYGSETGQFIAPAGIAINQSNGNVYVTDQGNFRVQEFSSSGSFIRAFGSKGTNTGQFGTLAGVTVDATGHVWVADNGNNRVQEFTETGSYMKTIGEQGTACGKFEGPSAIVVVGANLYITDYRNNRVQELSETGTCIRQFGSTGEGSGQFKGPSGLALDSTSGNLYVADTGNNRVQEFTQTGAYVTKFGSAGAGAGQFASPTAVGINTSGGAYVVDSGHNRIQEWTHSTWVPTVAEGPIAAGTTTYAYQTVEVEGRAITEPSEALAPAPAGVSCSPTLEKGCRALTFNYASSTTATGEARSEWGDYKGHLTRVYLTAWDPSKAAMSTTAVAQYAYDTQGRLRATWDPRIPQPLKTVYGYDSANELTALTRPGQETWAFTYGTIAGDPQTGRLIKATQAPTAAALWNGQPVKNTAAPKVTGTAAVGAVLEVSNGTWSNSPVAYGYQWEDCDVNGGACTPIAGATNKKYAVGITDAGHKLVAQVTATNGGGSVLIATAATTEVSKMGSKEYSLPAGSGPRGIATAQDGNLWFTNYTSSKIGKITTAGVITEYGLPAGSAPTRITAGPDGNLWFTNFSSNKIGKITPSGTVTEYALPTKSAPLGITAGPDGNLWFTDSESNKIGKITTAGVITEYARPAGSFPFAIVAGPDGNLWFTNFSSSKIGKITTAGVATEYALPASSGPQAITVGPDNNLWYANGISNKIGKVTTSGAVTEYSLPAGSGPDGITAGPDGNLWFTNYTSSRIGRITTAGTITEAPLPANSTPVWITAGPDGNLWFTNLNTNKIGQITLNQSQLGATPQPGSTIEYHVPVAGAGAPYVLSETEVAKWGQGSNPAAPGNYPVEGTAIIPADEPMGWPASSYKRASITYLDQQGRTVNVALPGGSISTTEYNALNENVRSLTPANRAAALKEGSKSAEVSKRLDTQQTYSADGTELLETLGPEHTVKLSTGTEVQARAHSKYSYDEHSLEGKHFGVVTKSTEAALVAGKDEDVRTTITSYSGQNGLGWKLRKPTSVTTDPAGLALTKTTVYDETTGNVIETRSPAANTETVYPPAYSLAFGSEGTGAGQFKQPVAVALDSAGNVWVDDKGNSRVEKFSSNGSFIAAYGSAGSGNGQFSNPWGIAVDQATGNVYVSDTNNNRVEELNSAGAFVRAFGTEGTGKLTEPIGVAVDSSSNVWVSDYAHNRVVEFSSSGSFIQAIGTAGTGNGQLSGPEGLVVSEGSLYVVDSGNGRIEQFSLGGSYLGQFGTKGSAAGQLKEPVGIAVNPTSGNLYVADRGNYRIEEFTPAGKFLCEWQTWGSTHQLSSPTGIAINATGQLYIGDQEGAKVSQWLPPETGGANLKYASQFGTSGSGNGQFSTPTSSAIDGEGNIWIADFGNNRMEKFSSTGTFIAAYGKEGTGNGEFEQPQAIGINQSSGNIYVTDSGNNRVEEFSASGEFIRVFGTSGSGKLNHPVGITIGTTYGNVWVVDTNNNRIVEFSPTGAYIAAFGSAGSGNLQFNEPLGITFSGPNLYITDSKNHRVEEISTTGTYIRQFGIEGEGSGELYAPEGIAADSAGNLYVVDDGASHVEEFSPSGAFRATFATKGSGEGQLNHPIGASINAAGALYVVDTGNNRVEKWISVNKAAHDTQTIYYSAAANSTYPSCGQHAEWANLVCQTQPAGQPESGLSLPITTFTYNLWDEIEVRTEKFGATNRTITETYDAAGRPLTSETASSVDTALPKVTNEYNAETGGLEKQSTTSEGKTKTITSVYNSVGLLTKYTDADGNTTTYEYEPEGDDRLLGVNDGQGTQTYAYDPISGFLTKLVDSGAGTFTASYDVEGELLTETYPNSMTARSTINSLGQRTGLVYEKTTHCATTCPETWFSDTIVPSIHGEMLTHTSSLAKDSYRYDPAGRLLQTQEEPTGKGCTTRLYEYDEESNRTALTTRVPGAEGKCATEGGATEKHSYDTGNRLTDPGLSYEAFGNPTTVPAADAGGYELTSSYYVDGQVATQSQNGQTLSYKYDPAGRTRETTATGKATYTLTSHYAGSGESLAWVSEGGTTWKRNIPGIDGALVAIQASSGSTVLQLQDLAGNIVAQASASEAETKLLSTYNNTEFGVPQPGTTPPKYAWLGAAGVSTELSSSGVATKGGASYVPQVGRAIQTEPIVPPGAFPNGTGTGSPYVAIVSAAEQASAQAAADKVWEEAAAARQKAAEEEAKRIHDRCVEEGGCGAAIVGVDPHFELMLSAHGVKLVLAALSSTKELAGLIAKWVGLKGMEATGLAEIIKLISGQVAEGLNICLNNWYNLARSDQKGYRCRMTFYWIQFGTIPVPEHLDIAECFRDVKAKGGHDCWTIYKVGWDLGLS